MKLFNQKTTLLSLALLMSASAYADKDWGVMELETYYECSSDDLHNVVKGEFTAPEKMLLLMSYQEGRSNYGLVPYKTADLTDEYQQSEGFIWDFASGSYRMELNAGQTIYLANKFPIDPFHVILKSGSGAPQINEILPANGSDISMGIDYKCTITFDRQISSGAKASIEAGGKSATVTPNIEPANVEIPMKDVLLGWLRSGDIKQGDKVTVTLSNVSNDYDKTKMDDVVVEYTILALPPSFQSSENTAHAGERDFYSYWIKGDPEGIVTLTFSAPLKDDGKSYAEIEYGDRAREGQGYGEIIPVTIDGNNVICDLTGKLRDHKAMGITGESQEANYSLINLYFKGIRGEDGQYCLTDVDFKVGSYDFQYTYVERTVNLVLDPTPAAKSEVKAGDEIELYLRGYDDIDFSGILFSYAADKVLLAKDDLTVETDPDDADAKLITFKMPELPGVVAGEQIVVSFQDVTSADGYDHSLELSFYYIAAGEGETPAPVTITAKDAEGNEVSTLNAGDVINVTITGVKVTDFTALAFTSGDVKATVEKDKVDDLNGDLIYDEFKVAVPEMEGVASGSEVKVAFEGLVTTDEADHSGELTFTFKAGDMAGIEAIFDDANALLDVYSIDGVMVARGVNRTALSNLPAGLYVVGGKKLIIK